MPSFHSPLPALRVIAIPVAWSSLQWIATAIANKMGWPNVTLTVISGLLRAWVLIPLATMLVANKVRTRFIALSAWTVTALDIFDWLMYGEIHRQ